MLSIGCKDWKPKERRDEGTVISRTTSRFPAWVTDGRHEACPETQKGGGRAGVGRESENLDFGVWGACGPLQWSCR